MTTNDNPHVVIIGGGFGGLETAKRLGKTGIRTTLVDRHNYHLFQPLLYQVATGGLSPANIAAPLRYILRNYHSCEVLLAEVVDFDVQKQCVKLSDGELDYDELVVAAGATHSYFGRDDWASKAPGLKCIADAIEIRRRVFLAFEAAERETDPNIRSARMTFVIVGGGPTGVELAGALCEIAKHTLKHDFRHINPEDARILIVEASQNVLAHYPEELCDKAAQRIRSLGIEIYTNSKVTDIAADHVRLATADGELKIETHTVLWAAGVQANPLGKILSKACGVEADRSGRVPVHPNLTVGKFENVFAIGDLANCLDAKGQPLPGLAPVAMQQGAYVAKSIEARVNGRTLDASFQYVNRGTMATIGRAAAVAHIGNRNFSGFFAWMLWLLIHLLQIVQFQNRMLILVQWSWGYLTYNRSARIITGEDSTAIVNPPRDRDETKSPPE